jgi:hypothetical protein
MAICAFLWDFETNAASALVWNWPGLNLANLVAVEVAGFLFPVPLAHELTDLFLGAFLAPAAIVLIPKVTRGA